MMCSRAGVGCYVGAGGPDLLRALSVNIAVGFAERLTHYAQTNARPIPHCMAGA